VSKHVAEEDFANLLQELKDRSERSYDALARRVGVSSSALHRYCSGTTVPNDFEIIERFGRICRLNRDELLELHRRWAVAVAARRGAAGPDSSGPDNSAAAEPAEQAAATTPPAARDRPPRRRGEAVVAAAAVGAALAVGVLVGLRSGQAHPPRPASGPGWKRAWARVPACR
jgi:transcriptional regulator with XRE-family HTH domain